MEKGKEIKYCKKINLKYNQSWKLITQEFDLVGVSKAFPDEGSFKLKPAMNKIRKIVWKVCVCVMHTQASECVYGRKYLRERDIM